MVAKAVADILWKGRYAADVDGIVDMLIEISEIPSVSKLLEEMKRNEQGLHQHPADTKE